VNYQSAVLTPNLAAATLTLTDGTHTAQFIDAGAQSYSIAPDGSGGTEIIDPPPVSATASITAETLLLASPRFISAAGNASPGVVQATAAMPGLPAEPVADPLGAAGQFGATAPNAACGLAGSVLSEFSIAGPIVPIDPNNETAVSSLGGSGSAATLPATAAVLAGHVTA
jgi:hypothetical protein